MDAPVLLEKVRPPEVTALGRPRLERAHLGPDAAGVVLVVAPPGAGKTTLLARVTAAATTPTAWFGIGAEDGAEAALVRHVAYSLAQAGVDVDPAVRTVDELIIAVQRGQGPVLLVLDDV